MEYNLADLWERVVDTVPDREALVAGERRLTYAEADERIDRLAHHLAGRGIGPGDHVALYLQNSPQFIIGYYAILRADAMVVPINPMNLTKEQQELLRQFEKTGNPGSTSPESAGFFAKVKELWEDLRD